MASYAELQSDIADELARDDLTGRIPRFVRQANQRINRDVRITDMVRRARAFGTGTRYLRSPPGFLEMRRMWNVIDSTVSVTEREQDAAIAQVSPQGLVHITAGGRLPSRFSVHRGSPPELEFDVALADDREVEMIYYKAYDDLADQADTNFVLDTHYDLYLEGALYYAAKNIKDTEESVTRMAAYTAAMRELRRAEKRLLYIQPLAAKPVHNVV